MRCCTAGGTIDDDGTAAKVTAARQTDSAAAQPNSAPVQPSNVPLGQAITLDRQAQLHWVRQGYRAALKALNQAHHPTEDGAQLDLASLDDWSQGQLMCQPRRGPWHADDTVGPLAAHAQSNQAVLAMPQHIPWPFSSSGTHVQGCADARGALIKQPCRSVREAQKTWASFAKQHDAIKFASACNAAAEAPERQVSMSCLLPPHPSCGLHPCAWA